MTPTNEQIQQFINKLNLVTQREVIRISLSLSENLSLTDSKIGGLPYIPKNGTLPITPEGEPLFMLAQINCEQLPENNLYPKKGLLQFWIANDELFGADFKNPCQNDTKKILYYPDFSDGMPVEQVKEHYNKVCVTKKKGTNIFEQEYDIELPFDPNKSLALSFEKGQEGISYQDIHFSKIAVKQWNKTFPNKISAFWALPEDILNIFFKNLSNGFGHKIGGYPDFAQDDPREKNDPHKILLLQLNSEYNDEYSIMWGDAGVANFFINKDDLAKCNFENVLYNWDCS